MQRSLISIFLSFLVTAASSSEIDHVQYVEGGAQEQMNSLVFKECVLSGADEVALRPAECAQLEVPEDYSQTSGKKISLFVARLKSSAKKSHADPLVLIAGGPGQSATESFIFPGMGFHQINKSRDIYLIDQRGTGKSNKLGCEMPDNVELLEEQAQIDLVKTCISDISMHSDLRQYTTSLAVKDLEQLRYELGVKQWNIYGVSYGTRVAQHYLRRYPESVRSVILDGVVSPDHVLGTEISMQSQRALDALIARCEKIPSCEESFPELRSGVSMLLKEIDAAPKKMALDNMGTGAVNSVDFESLHLSSIIRFSLYSPELASVLPIQLQAAYKHNNFLPLARLAMDKRFDMSEQISFGMHSSVVCSEDIAALTEERKQASMAAAKNTYLGTEMLDSLLTICEHWPKGLVDEDFQKKVHSEKPVLLMSGSADPITPPRYAEDASQFLSNSQHLVVEDFAHSVARVGCMPTLMAKFIESPAATLDASCLNRQMPAPIFLDFNGPQP